MNISTFLQAGPNVLLFKYAPLWLSSRYLRVLGMLYFFLNPRERVLIRNNIVSVFKDGQHTRSIIKKTFDGIFAHYSEKLVMAHRNYGNLKRELLRLMEYSGTDLLDRHVSKGGVILVTGHFGGVEFMPLALALRGYKVSMVVKYKTALLKKSLLARAEEVGVELIDANEGNVMQEAINALKRGRILLTESDEVESWKTSANKTIDAFGGKIFQDRTLEVLFRRSRATVLSSFMIRTKNGYQLSIDNIMPEMAPQYNISAMMLKKFEQLVMMFPDQWYEWKKFHKMRPEIA